MALITVYQTFSPPDAHLMRTRLEAADLHPTLANELGGGFTGSLTTGGILVQVPEEEVEAANEIVHAPPTE